jgi:hypothetical protein
MDFKGDRIHRTPSFGGEVKPSVPCRRFTACKRTLRARQVLVGKIQRPCFVPAFHLLRYWVVSAGFANRSLVVVSGGQKQVDRGADNPTSYIPIMKPVREAKARSRAMLCMIWLTMIHYLNSVLLAAGCGSLCCYLLLSWGPSFTMTRGNLRTSPQVCSLWDTNRPWVHSWSYEYSVHIMILSITS